MSRIFGSPPAEVLYDLSWRNALLFARCAPLPYDEDDEEGHKDASNMSAEQVRAWLGA